jgi:tetratricopeptide (TPR) repeat protein
MRNVEEVQLVFLQPLSEERKKYIWEDIYSHPWDEIIGRIYLLKANEALEEERFVDALADFEQALVLLSNDGVDQKYYVRALADKALVQCFLARYEAALATIDQALPVVGQFYLDSILENRAAILVLVGAYADALNALSAQLDKDPENECLRFTLATCLLHLERYHEAVVAYEQAIAEDSSLRREGLAAARLGQQPDWANL